MSAKKKADATPSKPAKKAPAKKAPAGKAASVPKSGKSGMGKKGGDPDWKSKLPRSADGKTVLLSGGNPQIPKGDGEVPVQAFISAMPEWKQDVGRYLDELIVRTVPGVVKAVKWNTPFYGIPGQGWFMGFHCITKYVKVAFMKGSSLKPEPPVGSKDPNTRYLHIHENEKVDEKQLAAWIKQASGLPGWTP